MSKAIHRAPLAIASDGAIIANVHHIAGDEDPGRLLELARDSGCTVFIGIVCTSSELRRALRDLDDAATATAAQILVRRMQCR